MRSDPKCRLHNKRPNNDQASIEANFLAPGTRVRVSMSAKTRRGESKWRGEAGTCTGATLKSCKYEVKLDSGVTRRFRRGELEQIAPGTKTPLTRCKYTGEWRGSDMKHWCNSRLKRDGKCFESDGHYECTHDHKHFVIRKPHWSCCGDDSVDSVYCAQKISCDEQHGNIVYAQTNRSLTAFARNQATVHMKP